ncbi:MAG: rhodanese-like domain-containing protein [Solimonas sp.]
MPTITVEKLHELIQRERPLVFDANPRRSWLKHRIPGAINIDPAEYGEQILPSDKSAQLVFCCSGPACGAGPYAARRAKKMGYTNVRVLSAGIKGWLDAALPTDAGDSDI